jgi:SAM-dependent methyltransferase
VIGALHERLVHRSRVHRLAGAIADLLPDKASVLDVGSGDGALAQRLFELRPDVRIQGVDVLVREDTQFPVRVFDGRNIPDPDNSVDVVLLVDVLHHTDDPVVLLQEAKRVARRAVVIKDHCRDGLLAGPTLRLMDWVGNAHHGVALPYNYWPRSRWLATFRDLKLDVEEWRSRLGLYSPPAGWVFDRSLHFLARLSARSGH